MGVISKLGSLATDGALGLGSLIIDATISIAVSPIRMFSIDSADEIEQDLLDLKDEIVDAYYEELSRKELKEKHFIDEIASKSNILSTNEFQNKFLKDTEQEHSKQLKSYKYLQKNDFKNIENTDLNIDIYVDDSHSQSEIKKTYRLEVKLTPDKYQDNSGLAARRELLNSKSPKLLKIEHDSNNIYDDKAIKVFNDDIYIGFIIKMGTDGKVNDFCFGNDTLLKNIKLRFENKKLFLIKEESPDTLTHENTALLENFIWDKKTNKVNRSKIMVLEKCGIETINHMTHISNLESIMARGLYAHSNPYKTTDISNKEVNSRRSMLEPVFHRSIHEYVPYYFNTRNAMLYRNQHYFGEDIIILGFEQDIILEENVLFTNNNASSGSASFTSDASELLDSDFIDWDRVFSNRWVHNGDRDVTTMQMMMAEVLIPKHVKSSKIQVIYCQSSSIKEKIMHNFKLNGIKVVVDTNKFF